MRPARRLALFSAAILTVLVAVLAVVLPAGIASAGTAPAAETRVWASVFAAPARTGVEHGVSAGQRLGEAASCPCCVSGSCVAPEDAGLGASSVPRTAFRGDTRSPSEVEAAGGFQPRAPGSSTSLREYVFNSTPSNFVGASKLPELAAGPAFSGPGNYVYEVSTEGLSPIDVNAELGSHIFAAEHELAFPGGIPFGNILRAFKIQEPFVLGPEVPGWP
jgi:hypothetical protein